MINGVIGRGSPVIIGDNGRLNELSNCNEVLLFVAGRCSICSDLFRFGFGLLGLGGIGGGAFVVF